jgi:hypothetical protein
MGAWSREVAGFDGATLELGYDEDSGFYVGLYRQGESDNERVGLTLWELVEVSRNYMQWQDNKQLFRVLQAAPVLLKAHDNPTDPTAKIVKQLCA